MEHRAGGVELEEMEPIQEKVGDEEDNGKEESRATLT